VDFALIAAVAAAVFTGAAFQRLSGIGFSLVAAPVLALISGSRDGVALTNLLAVVVALVVFATSARRVDKARALILIPAGLIGVLPGTLLFRLLSPGQLQVAVGTITVAGLAAVLLAARFRSRRLRPRRPPVPGPLTPGLPAGRVPGEVRPVATGCAGLASGFSAAAAGAGGPALTVYAVATGWPQPEFVATGQLSYVTQGAAALAAKGLPAAPGAWLAVAVGAVLCGLLAGQLAARRVDAARARRAAIIFAGLAALVTVVKGLLSLTRLSLTRPPRPASRGLGSVHDRILANARGAVRARANVHAGRLARLLRGSAHAAVVRRAEGDRQDQARAGQHGNPQAGPHPAARGQRLGPGRGRPHGRAHAPAAGGHQEQRRAEDDEEIRDVIEGAADVDEVHDAADAARSGQVVHPQPVQQVAAPSAGHQRAGDDDGGRRPAARQDRHGDAQQDEVEDVEQGAGERADVPSADRASDDDVAARVHPGPRKMPPGPPLDRLIRHDHDGEQGQDQNALSSSVQPPGGVLSRGSLRGGSRGLPGDG
jgi:hypothetical protein